MVKGISRRVVVVESPDQRYFEQAIFIVRNEAVGEGVTARELVEEAVQSAERARLLRTCMAELHEDYREALFLVYFEGLSHAETAAVMGKREKQVADLIYRGKIALRKRLEQEGITDAYNG